MPQWVSLPCANVTELHMHQSGPHSKRRGYRKELEKIPSSEGHSLVRIELS